MLKFQSIPRSKLRQLSLDQIEIDVIKGFEVPPEIIQEMKEELVNTALRIALVGR